MANQRLEYAFPVSSSKRLHCIAISNFYNFHLLHCQAEWLAFQDVLRASDLFICHKYLMRLQDLCDAFQASISSISLRPVEPVARLRLEHVTTGKLMSVPRTTFGSLPAGKWFFIRVSPPYSPRLYSHRVHVGALFRITIFDSIVSRRRVSPCYTVHSKETSRLGEKLTFTKLFELCEVFFDMFTCTMHTLSLL